MDNLIQMRCFFRQQLDSKKSNKLMNQKHVLALTFLVVALAALSWDALGGSQASQNAISKNNNDASAGLTGEQLWSNNCQRCHNLRPPQMCTPAQWQVIVHHMGVRANLTGADQRAILDFLKSASH
jgi:hypothetical protein